MQQILLQCKLGEHQNSNTKLRLKALNSPTIALSRKFECNFKGVLLIYTAIKFVAFLEFSQNFTTITHHASANHVPKKCINTSNSFQIITQRKLKLHRPEIV